MGSSLAKEELKRCSLPRLEYWRKFLTGGSHSGVSVCVIGRAGKDTTHSIPSLTPSFQSELRIYHLQSTSPRICSSDWRNNEKATDTQKEATVFCYSGVLPAKTLTGALSAEYFGPEFEVRAVGLSWVSMPILLV